MFCDNHMTNTYQKYSQKSGSGLNLVLADITGLMVLPLPPLTDIHLWCKKLKTKTKRACTLLIVAVKAYRMGRGHVRIVLISPWPGDCSSLVGLSCL